MSFFATYLLGRFVFRIGEFIRHWYWGGFFAIAHRAVTALEGLDQTIALRITIRYFFRPLYGDYSAVGRTLGFLFRSGRILIGLLIYPIVILGALALYTLWAAVPLYFAFTAIQL
mgnify:FL=1